MIRQNTSASLGSAALGDSQFAPRAVEIAPPVVEHQRAGQVRFPETGLEPQRRGRGVFLQREPGRAAVQARIIKLVVRPGRLAEGEREMAVARGGFVEQAHGF